MAPAHGTVRVHAYTALALQCMHAHTSLCSYSTPNVHCALLYVRKVYCRSTACLRFVLFAPLLPTLFYGALWSTGCVSELGPHLTQLMCAQCTAGKRGALVMYPMCVSRAPAVHCCAEKCPIVAVFLHRNAGVTHCCAEKLRTAAIFRRSNVPCKPMS